MNDIATIERALKDADLWLDNLVNDKSTCDPQEIRDQITTALTLLRQIPGQHSPTTAARQGFQALQNALHQYEAIGPSKMERKDLNLIRDAAAALSAPQATPERVWCVECDREGDWEWTYCAWCGSQTFTTADPRPA